MSKAKGGTGRGTDKKGWNRWQAGAKKANSTPKPYKTRDEKQATGAKSGSSKKADRSTSEV